VNGEGGARELTFELEPCRALRCAGALIGVSGSSAEFNKGHEFVLAGGWIFCNLVGGFGTAEVGGGGGAEVAGTGGALFGRGGTGGASVEGDGEGCRTGRLCC
jgi:hypothetical protein